MFNPTERSTMFEKSKVIERLKANRDGHKEKVATAQRVYHQKLTEELERRLEQAKNGEPVDPMFLQVFPIPQDYSKEYERWIDKLESSIGSEVELTDQEFNQLMRDEWDWTNRFLTANAAYLAG